MSLNVCDSFSTGNESLYIIIDILVHRHIFTNILMRTALAIFVKISVGIPTFITITSYNDFDLLHSLFECVKHNKIVFNCYVWFHFIHGFIF